MADEANPVHDACPAQAECRCKTTMGNILLRELLLALGWDPPASPDAPQVIWRQALGRVREAVAAARRDNQEGSR